MNGPTTKSNLGDRMTLGAQARWSIVQEASAPKAGNVHPSARFGDMDFSQFDAASQAIGEAIDQSTTKALGPMVWECTQAMLKATNVNTSLGTILLLAPLVQYEQISGKDIRTELLQSDWTGIPILRFLQSTNADDCAFIYRAIAACHPGGLGNSKTMDVLGPPPASIVSAMEVAADRDDVALQYCNGFLEVARFARLLVSSEYKSMPLSDAIRKLQLAILSERVDSLIVRKCELPMGLSVRSRAQQLLQTSPFGSVQFESDWSAFDDFLRCDGNRRNPGTTADMIAAALYCASPLWM